MSLKKNNPFDTVFNSLDFTVDFDQGDLLVDISTTSTQGTTHNRHEMVQAGEVGDALWIEDFIVEAGYGFAYDLCAYYYIGDL